MTVAEQRNRMVFLANFVEAVRDETRRIEWVDGAGFVSALLLTRRGGGVTSKPIGSSGTGARVGSCVDTKYCSTWPSVMSAPSRSMSTTAHGTTAAFFPKS